MALFSGTSAPNPSGRGPVQPAYPATAAKIVTELRPGQLAQSRSTSERRTLVVGRGISLQGVVQDAERLVVEGTVEATKISAAELSVEPGGVFRGECEVDDAEVSGTVD